jgi:hypothetical protein
MMSATEATPMAKGYGRGRSKSGGFVGNLTKLGGSKSKLRLKTDMSDSSMVHASKSSGRKQAHKKV